MYIRIECKDIESDKTKETQQRKHFKHRKHISKQTQPKPNPNLTHKANKQT